ncbi:ATP-binding cassette domain-containing protein [Cyclobacterium qasimii]|uniref:Molybdenum ABC transporter ATP-binding protein n=2 Tax=Cyclobacterium qasimii TaxID=1350429 RepID=A0A512CER8_9BACT|nr:ATP-binding cassette domain-containing protein [Cyclobacterium qasimii]EPR68719.1 putative molybdenum transport ATP-binding protein modF [Cyclobacterium qasimii M12-11B]GEO22708.1 molybdenum ABC transporter ATP-binding protein [Cyclobacterium qasimii]
MKKKSVFLEINNATVQSFGKTVFKDLNFTVENGESWAILGDSGKERTLFLETILGRTAIVRGSIEWPFAADYQKKQRDLGLINSFRDLIALVSQKYTFRNKSSQQNFYYQQRFNSSESEDTATVNAFLSEVEIKEEGAWNLSNVIQLFGLEGLKSKSLIKLSNGETRRLALAEALLKNPKLLLIDMPLVGLDVQTRADFEGILKAIQHSGIQVIMTSSAKEVPEAVDRIGWISGGKLMIVEERDSLIPLENEAFSTFNFSPLSFDGLLNTGTLPFSDQEIIKMNNVTIRYGEKKLLDNLSWQVNPGEKWLIKGHNGAGKSTLISLVLGENPQAYANDISLFGRKRGTGESIWDVKRPIGFVSAELARYFPTNQTCKKVVASGLFDTMGLFKKLTETQEALVDRWLEVFQLSHLSEFRLNQISLEEQRFCILARAMIKSPTLLVLDEASQGMDEEQRSRFKSTIEYFCQETGLTLLFVSHYDVDIPDCIGHTLELELGKVINK